VLSSGSDLVGYYFLVTIHVSYMVTTIKSVRRRRPSKRGWLHCDTHSGSRWAGRIVDRIGRKPLMIAGCVWMAEAAFQRWLLVDTGTIGGGP